ncbi:hypothetical protein C8A03DRAFT_37546 [Achaetomium macrosporum]|uniref:Prion-inhibition and propagation HeLo domain-containing protein n=1 Tax=Achaetomium macrosporum TaxID=79813 RepID=A0AAN7C3J6_9PEZI|nr:hypothetical protein C8A03DRAFT_37546 [Achaetomium macrosporum]
MCCSGADAFVAYVGPLEAHACRTRLAPVDWPHGGLSDIVQVETANKLICDLLEEISKALNEFRETAENRRGKAAAGLNKAWLTTKIFTNHVVYVLVDKGLVEKLIQKLSGLNDSLEKLLTLSQKVQYAKAVSSGVLVKYQQPYELVAVL